MLEVFESWMLTLYETLGAGLFLALSVVLSVTCVALIAWTTDLMVNNAAGLTAKHLGPKARTLVINASTNNPEAATMAVSMGIGRMGGWANPLGSLLANCYLMYFFGLLIVAAKFVVTGRFRDLLGLIRLIWRERRLVVWHVLLAVGMFVVGTSALLLLRYGFQWSEAQLLNSSPETSTGAGGAPLPLIGLPLYTALTLLGLAIIVFFLLEWRLKKERSDLFTDIDATSHGESWIGFIGGTTGLIFACWLMNAMFLAWSHLYSDRLEIAFGATAFAALHYILGAFMTSLPELLVAVKNYQRLTAPDLNTALGSASYSNLTNLIVAFIGLVVFAVLVQFGIVLPWQ